MAFLFYTVLIITTLIIIIKTSKIDIEVIQLRYIKIYEKDATTRKINKKRKLESVIKIKLLIFGKVPIFSIKINKERWKKIEKIKRVQKVKVKVEQNVEKLENNLIQNINNGDKNAFTNIIETAQKFNLKIKKLNMKINIGLDGVIATTIIIPIISTIVAFILRKTGINSQTTKYEIKPIYNMNNSRNEINIFLNCIFEVKVIHIINIMYFLKKGRWKNGTSNRRSYDYSYE